MKFALNDKAKGFYWFTGDKFSNFILFFFQKLDLSVFMNLKTFQPWYPRSELWSPKSSFIHGLLWIFQVMKGFSWLPGDKFLNFILFFQNLDLSVFVDLENFSPGSIRLKVEVLKLLHLCMDCYEDCFKW